MISQLSRRLRWIQDMALFNMLRRYPTTKISASSAASSNASRATRGSVRPSNAAMHESLA